MHKAHATSTRAYAACRSLRTCKMPPLGASRACKTGADCAGHNGECVAGRCVCHPGWEGDICGTVSFIARSASRAFLSRLWTWGGSIARADDGLVHMFASELTNDCGILHYCSNSRVIHLTASHPLGPYERRGVALSPRAPPAWDSGAIHGPTLHRISSRLWALYFMATRDTWSAAGGAHHPNCTAAVDPQQGDRATRRLGVAMAPTPWGPWTRRDKPLFGPGNRSAGEWDWLDVSNVTPIFLRNGTVVLLYKGRGHTQAMGSAAAAHFDGPFVRTSPTRPVLSTAVEDTWGWVQRASSPANATASSLANATASSLANATASWGGASARGSSSAAPGGADSRSHPEVLHVLSHVGNGASAAGGHAWSYDGVRWVDTTGANAAYTGRVRWASNASSVLYRRERPQVLLRPAAGAAGRDGASPGDSYGVPAVLCTSAQQEPCPHDGGPERETKECRSFTMCEAIAVE